MYLQHKVNKKLTSDLAIFLLAIKRLREIVPRLAIIDATIKGLQFVFAAPSSVVIFPNGCPDVGQNYSLTCRVYGLSNSTIQWSRGSNGVIHRNATLEFFPLAIGDAEKYKCTSVVDSSLSATENVTVNSKFVGYSCHRAT